MLVLSVDDSSMAHSLPTDVPESPSVPRTPRTPRTPGRQDPTKTPRFYPVIKEDSGNLDGKVSFYQANRFHDFQDDLCIYMCICILTYSISA